MERVSTDEMAIRPTHQSEVSMEGIFMKQTVGFIILAFLVFSGCDFSEVEETDNPEIVAASATSDDNGCGCKTIKGTVQSVVDFETFTAQGSIDGDLKGSILFTGDPTAVSPISGETYPPLNPETLTFTGQVEISTKKGTITTRSVGVFEAGPLGNGTQFDHIVSGTGDYADATGTLFFNVQSDESGANFFEEVSGQICMSKKVCSE